MALSGSVSTNHFSDSTVNETYMTFNWSASQNKDGNYSTVSWNITAHRPGTNNYVYFHNFNRTVNGSWSSIGSTRYSEGSVIDSGSFTVYHDSSSGDGSFSISMAANVYYNGGGYISASQTFYLDRIPRYANFTEHYVKSTGLNSISVRWNADHTIDWVQYSLNGAAWADTSGLDYTIGGLGPNTSYSIKTRIRRKDSGLWTESGTIYGTTKDIAKITEAINVNDEQKPYMKYTNPSGSNFNPYIELLLNGSIVAGIKKSSVNKTSGEYTFELTQDEKNLIYEKSANSPTIGIRYGVETLGSNNNKYWHWSDKTMTIINADPVFTDFTIEENNEKVFALTGDRYKHIKKYSSLKILITSGNKMIPQKSATAVKYRAVVGQQTKDITYSENDTYQIIDNMDANTVQVFAVDSRKKETLKEKSLDIINYKELVLNNIEFNRKNGVEETVIITGNGTWTNVDFGEVINSIKTFAFRCKKKKEIAWSDWYSIKELFHINEDGKFNNKVENEFTATTFDFGEEYDVEVKIEDELSTVVRPASVNSGKILMSALKEYGVCFGGVYDKNLGGALQVKGKNLEELAAGVTGDTLPIGSVMEWFVETIPVNWLRLDGQAVSRTDYKELFALYGTTYGAGDGSTTFNLPDMRTRVPVGKTSADSDFNALGKKGGEKTHTLTVAEMPKHNHYGLYDSNLQNERVGAWGTGTAHSGLISEMGTNAYENFATGFAGSNQAHNNLQPYITVHFIVKAKQSSGVVANVVDLLSSTSTTDALSANQGKILNEKIVGILNGMIVNGGNGRSLCIDNQDLNTIRDNGFYYGNGVINGPTIYGYLLVISHFSSPNYAVQIFIHQSSSSDIRIYIRQCDADNWNGWRQFSLV